MGLGTIGQSESQIQCAHNVPIFFDRDRATRKNPLSHTEAKLLKKLDTSIQWVWALTTTLSKCKSQKCKNFSEALGWSKKSFVRSFENYPFESVFFKSVEIESVVVSK